MDYILSAPRTSLISHNKEGIVSLPGAPPFPLPAQQSHADADLLPGYLAVHLLGLSTGTLLLPPTPTYFSKRLRELTGARPRRAHDSDSESDDNDVPPTRAAPAPARRENDKTATYLCGYAALWWAFLGACRLADIGGGISRRVVSHPSSTPSLPPI